MTSPDRLNILSAADRNTWKVLYETQALRRSYQMVDLFSEGLQSLGIHANEVPNLQTINKTLFEKTGFKGVPVAGLEGPRSFFTMLAHREFPIGNFIRNSNDLAYTPEPDIFHDLYGHIPFYANRKYADFSQRFGEAATLFFHDSERLRQFERMFWFTFEFGLIRTAQGLRIFGAGIASSYGECEYALSGQPELIAFDLNKIRNQEFRIDQMQQRLFVLDHVDQLYDCLGKFVEKVTEGEGG